MKKFYRSTRNKYISGICGGLGYHTRIDPILWRALLITLGPATILPYIVLTFMTGKK